MWFTPLLQGAAQQQAGAGQWQFVANAVFSNTGSAITAVSPSFAVSVGQLVVVSYGWEQNAGGTVSVTDSAGNTYTALTKYTSNGPQWVQLFYTVATAASASNVVTATAGLSVSFRNLTVQVFQPPPGTVSIDTSSGGSSTTVLNLTGVNVDPVATGSSLVTFSSKVFNSGTYDPGEIGWQETDATSHFISMFQNVSSGNPRPVGVKRVVGGTTSYVYAWASFVVTQAEGISRPGSDITVTGWIGDPDNANLYNNIDEVSPNDADYIISPSLSGSPGPAVFGLSSTLDAGTYNVRTRARRTGTTGQIRALLLDASGTTVGTGSWQALTQTPITYELSVTTSGTAARVRIEVQA